jgi:hypothetical protein
MKRALFAGAIAFALVACVGTTGGAVVDFPAAAAGPADATGDALLFQNDRGFSITLARATLRVGAVYLDAALPVSGAQATACVLPGTYVAQVTTGIEVDLLSQVPQKFPEGGHGTTTSALAGQVWITGGDVNDATDETPILQIAGTAEKDGKSYPFTGTITIAENRQQDTSSGAAGGSPICKQRIVSPIPTNVQVDGAGGLLLRIDPRLLFTNVDFSQLVATSPGMYAFSDDPSSSTYTQPSINLYANLHSGGAVYAFSWSHDL